MKRSWAVFVVWIFSMMSLQAEDNKMEIYLGGTYDLARSSTLTQAYPTLEIHGHSWLAGLYLPIFGPLALSWDIGVESHYNDSSNTIGPGSFTSITQTMLLTADIASHRINAGILYHQNSVVEIGVYGQFVNTITMQDGLGLTAGYEYAFPSTFPLALGIRLESTPYQDASHTVYYDNSLKVLAKFRIIGWQNLLYFLTHQGGVYY